jgi:hypothetical protein
MVTTTTDHVRRATPDDLPAGARLRWRWVVEENDATDAASEDEFVATFVAGAPDHTESHRCVVADRLGVERVVVPSSERAVSAYDRAGFASDERLRHRRLRPVGAPPGVRGA